MKVNSNFLVQGNFSPLLNGMGRVLVQMLLKRFSTNLPVFIPHFQRDLVCQFLSLWGILQRKLGFFSAFHEAALDFSSFVLLSQVPLVLLCPGLHILFLFVPCVRNKMMTKTDVVPVLTELMFQQRRQERIKQMKRKIANCDGCCGGNSCVSGH